MSKIRIYVEPQKIGDFIKIAEMNVVHKIKNVLRLNEGDAVFVFDGVGNEFAATIKYLQHDSLTLRSGEKVREAARSEFEINLAFPMTREEKVDLILQKATELGVTAFLPFTANRGLKVNPSDSKAERWHSIIKEACRQSERLWLPALLPVQPLDQIIAGTYDKKIFADIKGAAFGSVLGKKSRKLLLVVGPEGDFSPEEKKFLLESGFTAANIGENILRVETAAIFLTGLASYFLHE